MKRIGLYGVKVYGKVFCQRMFGINHVHVSGQDLVKQVLTSKTTEGRESWPTTNYIYKGNGGKFPLFMEGVK